MDDRQLVEFTRLFADFAMAIGFLWGAMGYAAAKAFFALMAWLVRLARKRGAEAPFRARAEAALQRHLWAAGALRRRLDREEPPHHG